MPNSAAMAICAGGVIVVLLAIFELYCIGRVYRQLRIAKGLVKELEDHLAFLESLEKSPEKINAEMINRLRKMGVAGKTNVQ